MRPISAPPVSDRESDLPTGRFVPFSTELSAAKMTVSGNRIPESLRDTKASSGNRAHIGGLDRPMKSLELKLG
jgi:hypothetical protein